MVKDTWTKFRRLLSRAVNGIPRAKPRHVCRVWAGHVRPFDDPAGRPATRRSRRRAGRLAVPAGPAQLDRAIVR
jgi:hypothetical protein